MITRDYNTYTFTANNGKDYKVIYAPNEVNLIGVKGMPIKAFPSIPNEILWLKKLFDIRKNYGLYLKNTIEVINRLLSMGYYNLTSQYVSWHVDDREKDLGKLLKNWKNVVKCLKAKYPNKNARIDIHTLLAETIRYEIRLNLPSNVTDFLYAIQIDTLASYIYNNDKFRNNKKFINMCCYKGREIADFLGTHNFYEVCYKIERYFNMCEEMGVPTETGNFFSNYIKTLRTYRAKKNEVDNKKLLKWQTRKDFYYSNENFEVIIPTTKDEFINEGYALNNCLGNYELNNYVLTEKRNVVFIRQIEDVKTPYVACDFTINGTICQFLSYNNQKPIGLKILDFKNEYQNYLDKLFAEID